MKNLIVLLTLILSSFIYAQGPVNDDIQVNDVKFKGMDVSMTFNYEEELNDFDVKELEEVFEKSSAEEKLSFKLKYEDPNSIFDGKAKRSFSYKVEGSSDDLDKFLTSINHIKKMALKVLKDK